MGFCNESQKTNKDGYLPRLVSAASESDPHELRYGKLSEHDLYD